MTRKKHTTIHNLAAALGLDLNMVRDVLREAAPLDTTKDIQDRIFQTARDMGYDFRKLKIGKRIQHHKELLEEILERVSDNPGWGRGEIVQNLKDSLAFVNRVHKRVFRDEFGEGEK